MKVFNFTFWLSVALIVGGFFCPPIGAIDGSILTAVGLLIMFAAIDKLPEAIRSAKTYKISHGDTIVEVTSKDESATD